MAAGDPSLCFETSSTVAKSFEKSPTLSALRKLRKNKLRSLRRKKSKRKYWSRQRQLRIRRSSRDLCATISVFDITDMDIADSQPIFVEPLVEVSTWHSQHQVAYWKSRATALEIENRMLHKHLEELYTRQVQDYVDYMREHGESEEVKVSREYESRKPSKGENSSKLKKQEFCKPPDGEARKKKQEQMITLYGDMAPKIRGMETATQLNYDLYVEKHNPPYWPNIPINL